MSEKRTRAPGGGRKAKPPGEKFRRFSATLPPDVYAAVELCQEDDEEFSAALARILETHPVIAAMIDFIRRAREQHHTD